VTAKTKRDPVDEQRVVAAGEDAAGFAGSDDAVVITQLIEEHARRADEEAVLGAEVEIDARHPVVEVPVVDVGRGEVVLGAVADAGDGAGDRVNAACGNDVAGEGGTGAVAVDLRGGGIVDGEARTAAVGEFAEVAGPQLGLRVGDFFGGCWRPNRCV
jgi:hypothetical protein